MYGIKNEDYLKSLGPENFLGNLILTKNRSLREMYSAGKSGSFFYYSYDNQFVLKTISTPEFEFFKSIIENYYFHIKDNENTLIQRFFGLHTMIFNDIKMHFVIMNNVFNTKIKINFKYDLKGSSYSRMSRNNQDVKYEKFDFNIPMKDNDFTERKEGFDLPEEIVDELYKEIKKDTKFLAGSNINDYSLLIGVHDCGIIFLHFFYIFYFFSELNKNFNDSNFKSKLMDNDNDRKKIEKRISFFEKNSGGLVTIDGKKIIFIAIIDLFTQYGYLFILIFYKFNLELRKKWKIFSKELRRVLEFLVNLLMNI